MDTSWSNFLFQTPSSQAQSDAPLQAELLPDLDSAPPADEPLVSPPSTVDTAALSEEPLPVKSPVKPARPAHICSTCNKEFKNSYKPAAPPVCAHGRQDEGQSGAREEDGVKLSLPAHTQQIQVRTNTHAHATDTGTHKLTRSRYRYAHEQAHAADTGTHNNAQRTGTHATRIHAQNAQDRAAPRERGRREIAETDCAPVSAAAEPPRAHATDTHAQIHTHTQQVEVEVHTNTHANRYKYAQYTRTAVRTPQTRNRYRYAQINTHMQQVQAPPTVSVAMDTVSVSIAPATVSIAPATVSMAAPNQPLQAAVVVVGSVDQSVAPAPVAPPIRKNHACEACGKAFRDVYHLNRHRLSHSDEKPYSCPICQQRFKRKDRMSYHVRSHQGGVEKPYVCPHCAKAFSRPDHLNSHVRQVHSTERPFKCTTCTSAFATRDRLRAHLIRHEEKVPCHICGKLLSAAYITDHMRVHNQSQHHSCHLCNRSFTTLTYLRVHAQKHHGQEWKESGGARGAFGGRWAESCCASCVGFSVKRPRSCRVTWARTRSSSRARATRGWSLSQWETSPWRAWPWRAWPCLWEPSPWEPAQSRPWRREPWVCWSPTARPSHRRANSANRLSFAHGLVSLSLSKLQTLVHNFRRLQRLDDSCFLFTAS
ncbi:hypothetical protein WMY93_001730 [Mugilogobius chulae]|uniref:C2H2-type domain-containing protein n=1 Tax=Mugilogobius chulae TaxID=88201 RepID=A0AAW0PV08_9GOBI